MSNRALPKIATLAVLLIFLAVVAIWRPFDREIPSISVFGVTPGQSINRSEYKVPDGYERLFAEGYFAVIALKPEGETFLPDWDHYIGYVVRETNKLDFVTSSKRYDKVDTDSCFEDLKTAQVRFEKAYDVVGTRVSVDNERDHGSELMRVEFSEVSSSISCHLLPEGEYFENGIAEKTAPSVSLSLRVH